MKNIEQKATAGAAHVIIILSCIYIDVSLIRILSQEAHLQVPHFGYESVNSHHNYHKNINAPVPDWDVSL